MNKRIVVCCDGTWNSPDQEDREGVPCPTNVVKVACAVAPVGRDNREQVLYYNSGVGTMGRGLPRRFDGATGTGLSRNIQDAYSFLVQNFEVGDELFLFGFSRGAYTVRSLAGLIRNCGILRKEAAGMIDRAFNFYRSRSRGAHPGGRAATLFRKTYSVSDKVPVRFIGVWDTVGSLGNPLLLNKGFFARRNRFHDTELSSHVEHAFQALAIDEKRMHFDATLWYRQKHAPAAQQLEQVWFAGVHSDIGGGYSDASFSDISLQWMTGKAAALGLGLEEIDPPPAPDIGGAPHESRKGMYRLTPVNHRRIGRPPAGKISSESLHPTVLQKWLADPSYRPASLRDYFRRHPGEAPNHGNGRGDKPLDDEGHGRPPPAMAGTGAG